MIVALVAIAIAAGIYVASRRDPVSATNVNDVPETTQPAAASAV